MSEEAWHLQPHVCTFSQDLSQCWEPDATRRVRLIHLIYLNLLLLDPLKQLFSAFHKDFRSIFHNHLPVTRWFSLAHPLLAFLCLSALLDAAALLFFLSRPPKTPRSRRNPSRFAGYAAGGGPKRRLRRRRSRSSAAGGRLHTVFWLPCRLPCHPQCFEIYSEAFFEENMLVKEVR